MANERRLAEAPPTRWETVSGLLAANGLMDIAQAGLFQIPPPVDLFAGAGASNELSRGLGLVAVGSGVACLLGIIWCHFSVVRLCGR